MRRHGAWLIQVHMEAVKPENRAPTRRVGVVQMRCEPDHARNLRHAQDAIADAAREGAEIVCLPELFRTPYLCQSEDPSRFDWAEPIPGPSTEQLSKQASDLGVSIVGSLFERRTAGLYHNTAVVIDALYRVFPDIQGPKKDDICYATQNRQVAVKEIARDSDVVIVVGSGNSSNSVRLVEVALEAGAGSAYRVDSAQEIDSTWFDGATTVGVTSGASVPDVLVNDVLDSLKKLGFGTVEEVTTAEETLVFALPPELRRDLKAASAEASANASS